MLEGTMGVAESRTPAGTRSERPRAERHPAHAARRRELLARLSAMSLEATARPHGGDPGAETEALAVARAWLDLIDNGRYAVGWSTTTNEMQGVIGADDWDVAVRSVRAPLGRCRSRALRSKATVEPFPGAPEGRWIVIRFESAFERRSGVTETVTTRLDRDGHWHVAAYYVG